MSLPLVIAALEHTPDVRGTAHAVLIALADRAGADGLCSASMLDIACRAKIASRTAWQHWCALRDARNAGIEPPQPSEATLRHIDNARRQARRIVGQLEELGLIEPVRGGGRGRANVYRVRLTPPSCTEHHETETGTPESALQQQTRTPESALTAPITRTPESPFAAKGGQNEPETRTKEGQNEDSGVPRIYRTYRTKESARAGGDEHRLASNGEGAIDELKLVERYPVRAWDPATVRRLVVGALEHLVAQGRTREDAAEWLRGRVGDYATATGDWPNDQRRFIPGLAKWLRERQYEIDPEHVRQRGQPKYGASAGPKAHELREHISAPILNQRKPAS